MPTATVSIKIYMTWNICAHALCKLLEIAEPNFQTQSKVRND